MGAGTGGTPIAGTGTGGDLGGAGGTPIAGTGGDVGPGGMATGGGGPGGSSTGGTGGSSTPGAVTVQLGMTKQTIDGFGINDNWGQQFSATVADSLFTTTGTGIGLTILRTGMNESGNFTNSFEANNISAVKSRAGTNAKIIGSVWSPPANCKTNNSINDGGHVTLSATCATQWATAITNFARTNQLYAMSIGNEPDFASCGTVEPCNGNYPTTLFTANEMVTWVKMAGTMLKAAGIKVIAPEASEWLHNWSNVSATGSVPGNKNSSDPLNCGCFGTNTNCASTCSTGGGYDYGHYLFRDSAAWAAFDIMGVHQYDTQRAEPWPSDVTSRKPVWQTEMSGVKWWPEQGTINGTTVTGTRDINNGVAVAGWIHDALTVGEASAWLWWWYQSYGTDDNEGLLLKNGMDTKRHYTFGNYSKFVRPGYVRVDVTGSVPAGVLLSAYKGSDGTVVVVAINKGTAAATVPITIAGGTAPGMLTPSVTSASQDLVSGTAVAVSGGIFMASLPSMTVTTFVGK
jgi:glucuronoarabinoxylan endo-1,4-beta-xylanase